MADKFAHKVYSYDKTTGEYLPFYGSPRSKHDIHRLNELAKYKNIRGADKRGFSVVGIPATNPQVYYGPRFDYIVDFDDKYYVAAEDGTVRDYNTDEVVPDVMYINEDSPYMKYVLTPGWYKAADLEGGLQAIGEHDKPLTMTDKFRELQGSLDVMLPEHEHANKDIQIKLLKVKVPEKKIIPSEPIPLGYDTVRDSVAEHQVKELTPVKEEKFHEVKLLPKGYMGQEMNREWFKKFRAAGWSPEDILEYSNFVDRGRRYYGSNDISEHEKSESDIEQAKRMWYNAEKDAANERKMLFRMIQYLKHGSIRKLVEEQFKNIDDNVSDKRLKVINENV